MTTVVAAGNEGDEGGFGTISSPGSAADAITVAAVTNDRIFAPAAHRDRQRVAAVPGRRRARSTRVPASWGAGLTLQVLDRLRHRGRGAAASLLVTLDKSCTAEQAAAAVTASRRRRSRARQRSARATRSTADARGLAGR